MSALDPRFAACIRRLRIVVEPEPVVLVHLPREEAGAVQRRADRFYAPFCLVFAPHEVTLVCREVEWEHAGRGLRGAKVESGYRMITLDVSLDPDTIGYLEVVTGHLARAGVPVTVLSTFHRDHLLVPASHLEAAVRALEDLVALARTVAGEPAGSSS
jgi:hypothetical protein